MSHGHRLPYRRCVITDEISQDIERAIALALEFGLEGLEIRSVWDKTIHELNDDELARLKRLADEAGLAIPAVAPPFLKCRIDSPDEWTQHRRILERTFRAADRLGARIVRGFTFWRQDSYLDHWERIVDAYLAVVPAIEQSDLTVAIENEGACMIGTTEPLVRLVREINSRHVRALWDPANGFHDGERAYPDAYQRVISETVHIHVKDGRITGDRHEHAILGDGQVGLGDVFGALARDSFDQWVSLETHYRPNAIEADFRRPGGRAFSESGEQGTYECLTAWNRLLGFEEG
jgi:L-ribulose-5-phosphate 3-epimerase